MGVAGHLTLCITLSCTLNVCGVDHERRLVVSTGQLAQLHGEFADGGVLGLVFLRQPLGNRFLEVEIA